MLGAREGCYKTNLTDWDYRNVRDFDYLTEYWNANLKDISKEELERYMHFYQVELRRRLDLDVVTFDGEQSKFFKKVYRTHRRVDIIEND